MLSSMSSFPALSALWPTSFLSLVKSCRKILIFQHPVLDELEREEFYRLKKVQDKKKKIRKEKEAMAAERRAKGLDEGDGVDIFEEEHDEDLLF